MIQRIQTVFLIFSLVFQILMLFFPTASFNIADKKIIELIVLNIQNDSIFSLFTLIILIINSLLIVVIIFLYKNRINQMKLCFVSLMLLLGYQLFIFYSIWKTEQQLEVSTNYKIAIAFPLVSAILSYLALRSIKKDEKLIRSIDRIR